MLDHLNGCYTRLLRIANNVDWTAHARNSFLYGNGTIPPLGHTIAKRTLRFAGHAFRAKDQLVPDIMMFKPRQTILPQDPLSSHGRNQRRTPRSYVRPGQLEGRGGALDNVGSMMMMML